MVKTLDYSAKERVMAFANFDAKLISFDTGKKQVLKMFEDDQSIGTMKFISRNGLPLLVTAGNYTELALTDLTKNAHEYV